MANSIKVSFWLHRSKMNNLGKVPLQIRLTYQSKKIDKATGYYVAPSTWNTRKQRMKGNTGEQLAINNALHTLQLKAITLFNQAQEKEDVYLPEIMEALFAKQKDDPTLLATIALHNSDLKARVGKDYSHSTYEKYEFMADKIKAFMQQQKRSDIRLKDLTVNFIIDFDHYMRTQDNNQHNTAVKYCHNLKRVINVAVLKGLIPSNPFNSFKTVYKDTQQVYLDERELDIIRNVNLPRAKYSLARDLFLFQANTGLAYTDLAALTPADVSFTEGRQWIVKPRQKSDVVATIPILDEAARLITKYQEDERRGDFLFPTISIQKYNQALGEIGEIAGLHKRISSHVGRRTFGNVALARGVSLNVISKILGHSNTIITQRIYAHTTQTIINKEMEKWK
ncbi:MAG: site-specific integrase [Chitinophagaceae bacterium]